MADEFDPFQLSTGLPEKLDICIQQAWFEFDPEYNNGQTLIMKMEVESTDDEFGEGGKGVIMYPCGNGWDQEQQGAVAVREDGTSKGFNQQSGYGLFIGAAIQCDGAEPVLRGENRGDPRAAAMWVNTCWHLERVERDYGGDIGKRSRLLPKQFLGEGSSIHAVGVPGAAKAGGVTKVAGPTKAAGVTKAAAIKKAAGPVQKVAGATKAAGAVKKAAGPGPTPPAAAPVAELPPEDNGEVEGFGPDHPLWQPLYDLAMASADHTSFVEAAFGGVDGVAGVPDIEQAVMADGDGSLWVQVMADYAASQG